MSRTTETDVCKALAHLCDVMGIPCAYELDGKPVQPYSRAYAMSCE